MTLIRTDWKTFENNDNILWCCWLAPPAGQGVYAPKQKQKSAWDDDDDDEDDSNPFASCLVATVCARLVQKGSLPSQQQRHQCTTRTYLHVHECIIVAR